MLNKIFKYGFFLRLYFILKGRISNWFYYIFFIIIVFYTHGEIKELSIIINNEDLTIWSYIIKNFLLLLAVGYFILKETNIFKSKTNIIANTSSTDNLRKVKNTPLEGDGFDSIRKKKYLSTLSKDILNKKNKTTPNGC